MGTSDEGMLIIPGTPFKRVSDEEFIAELVEAITRPITDAEIVASPFGYCGCAILQTIPARIPPSPEPEVITS